MRVEDLNKLDWRQDKGLLAIERKLAGLSDLESQARARLAELDQTIRTAEASLVQARVARMLDEASGEQESVIHERLSASRREIADLQADLEATKIAKKRMEPSLAAAASEAKLRVAHMLLGPYKETAESLQALLRKAVELNQLLCAVHEFTVKHNLGGEIVGNKVLKPLSMQAGWSRLSQIDGQPSGDYAYWDSYVKAIFSDN